MPDFAPASIHVKRHLSRRELSTIAVALHMLATFSHGHALDEVRALVDSDEGLMSNEAIVALASELIHARKVKVCRSKRSDA